MTKRITGAKRIKAAGRHVLPSCASSGGMYARLGFRPAAISPSITWVRTPDPSFFDSGDPAEFSNELLNKNGRNTKTNSRGTGTRSYLGFAVKVLGEPGLKSNDARRWQSNPHLRVSLGYLEAIFGYLDRNRIKMYRMSSDLVPYASHPDLPQFHSQVKECRNELAALGKVARRLGLRLSFHPSQFVILNSPDPVLREKSIWDLRVQADVLDAMGMGPEAALVIHAGGLYGDTQGGIDRWSRTWEELPERVRSRLVLENDDLRFSAADVLAIHARTGVRLIFDVQHFWCLNPQGLTMRPTLQRFLATWPTGERPKIHFSSPRTEMREVCRINRKTGKKETVLQAPLWTGHADFVHPFEFISFCREMADLDFDILLEAKAKDLALLRVRQDLVRYAPDVAGRFGLGAEDGSGVPVEIAAGNLEIQTGLE